MWVGVNEESVWVEVNEESVWVEVNVWMAVNIRSVRVAGHGVYVVVWVADGVHVVDGVRAG